jgi:VanZ family protein
MPRLPKRPSLIAAAVALLALVIFAKLPQSTQFAHVLHKTGHPVAFALLALIVLKLLPARSYVLAFALAVAAGAATEVAQIFLDRGPSPLDVLRDAGGALAALGLHAGFYSARRALFLSVGGVAAFTSLAPLLLCTAAYINRERQFPVLLQFRSSLDRYFIPDQFDRTRVFEMPTPWVRSSGEKTLQVGARGKWSAAVVFLEPHRDWSAYQTLAIDITNPEARDLQVMLRVHDLRHNWLHVDRFNRKLRLPAGQRIVVRVPLHDIQQAPKGRLLNLKQVAEVALFVPDGSTVGQFLLSRMWLERE